MEPDLPDATQPDHGQTDAMTLWRQWLAECAALCAEILARRGGQPIDVDALWQETRADLEARDEERAGSESGHH